ncbi:MAG: hypothetical protein RL065_1641, partial [Bacteroidota bacterium]
MNINDRKFNDPLWGETIITMQRLSAKLPWANRLRHPYYFAFKRNFKNGIKLQLSFWAEALLFLTKHFIALFQKKPTSKFTNHKIVFFLDFNTAYLNALLPLCKAMSDKGLAYDIFIPQKNYQKVIERLQQEKIPLTSVFSDANFYPENYFVTFFSAIFSAKIEVLKWLFSDVKKKFFLLPNVWHYSFHQQLYQKQIQKYLATKKYLLGAGDHWFWDSMFYLEAQNTDCTSIVVQHGLMGEFNYPMLSKKYWVWGKHDFEVMTQQFLAPTSEIEMMGSAHFDAFAKKINHHSSSTKKSITFFTQPYFKYKALGDELYENVVKWFLQLQDLAAKNNLELLIKWHQLDDEKLYPFVDNKIKTSRENLDKVLAETLIGITVDSAIMFESAMANVLMLQLKHPDFERFIDFSSDNLTLTVQSADELKSTVEKLITDKNFLQQQTDLMQKAIANYLANQTKTVEVM